MTVFTYFLIASLYMVVFYGFYRLFLQRTTFFTLNRTYLLISLVASLIFPLVELPINAPASLPLSQITLPTIIVNSRSGTESSGVTSSSVAQVLGLLYAMGVGLMMVRLGLTIASVFRLIRRGTATFRDTYVLIRLPDEGASRVPSFSFGRYMVLNYQDGMKPSPALLSHEEAHIRQWHTVDVLFLEIVRVVFWFNPILGLYKTALQEVHEFLADRTAVQTLTSTPNEQPENQSTYAQQLVAYALHVPITALTTPFAVQSTLKQRLIMLQKPLTHRRALLSYGLVIPIAASLLMCTRTESDSPLSVVNLAPVQREQHKPVRVDGDVLTVVEQQPAFPGGMKQLGDYITANLRYPAAAWKVKAEGRVFVSFIVTKTGEIADIKILKGIGFGTEEEVERIVSQMPRWVPARHNGQLVNVRYNLPINFQLD